jgi:phage tail-like protein
MATLGDADRRAEAFGANGGPPAALADGTGAPPTASGRAYLRAGLPAIYHDGGGLAMRFVGALETVLDPVVTILDSLEHHVEADLAPPDLLVLLAAWLGVELDESWPEERKRELIRRAGELHRRRGTRAGLELALTIGFPDLPIRVEDHGGVAWSRDPDGAGAPAGDDEGFVVYCDVPLAEPAVLAQAVEQLRPVHVPWRLRIREEGAS